MATLPQTHSEPRAWDTWLARAYTLNWEAIAYTVIFVLALVTRFWELGARVMSHDESLHTYYSWRLYAEGDFQHTPLMHGPLLFHATAFFYFLFGDNDFTGRIYTGLIGIAVVMFPILFRRWLGRTGAMLTSVGLLISPMILYYSRYIRHDMPSIFFALVMVYCMLQYLDGERPRRPLYMILFSGAFLLLLASKEVAFMYVAIFGSFLTFYWVLRILQDAGLQPRPLDAPADWEPPEWQALFGHLLVAGAALLLGFFGGQMLYYWQYASFGYLWIPIAIAGVLLIRHIPGLAEGLVGLPRGDSYRILLLIIILTLMLGAVMVIFGVLAYDTNNRDIDYVLETGSFVTSDGRALPALDALSDSRRNGGMAALIGVVLMLGGTAGYALARYPNEEERPVMMAWLLHLGRLASGAIAVVLVLRLLTMLTIDPQAVAFSLGIDITQERLAIIASVMVFFILMESVGFVRSGWAGRSQPGLAQMFMNGLGRPKSASMLIIAGTIIGGIVAVYAFGALDIIKPGEIWEEVQVADPDAPPIEDAETGSTIPATITQIRLDTHLANALLTWLAIPIVGAILLVVIVAVAVTPHDLPIPWTDVLLVLFAALLVGSVLVYVERHSLETTEESTEEPVAIDPNAPGSAAADNGYNVPLILGTTLTLLVLAGLIGGWRLYFPHHWEYFNRQPTFDILIVMGTLILPWLSALPIFLAGYTLDAAPLPSDTEEVIIFVTGATLLLSAAIGFAWNPRVWVLSNIVFLALFVFFFTTVFTNGHGVFTGMVGSLGYWLEQQGVRRGSQPQYYYTLIQIPLYEYLPALLASIGGVGALAQAFRWRNYSLRAERHAADNELSPAESTSPIPMNLIMEEQPPLEALRAQADLPQPDPRDILPDANADLLRDMAQGASDAPQWARPYNRSEEALMRETRHEWLGEFPFLQFVGFWGILMIVALTVAGEKMPWLTTHISVPLLFVAGWYAGKVVENISWDAIKRGGWALLLFLLPVLMVATVRVFAPLMGGDAPFQGVGRTQLSNTNEWIAALLVMLGAGYFVIRMGLDIGMGQLSRMSFAAFGLVLAVLTTRVAVQASFLNYDLATEFLVYAHAAPAITTVIEEIDYFAERTNEGDDFRVAYDDDTSWPMTWYMRDRNAAFFAGDAEALENNPGVLDGARIVVVGGRKNAAVERILGDEYYAFEYIRLWWPMQEYFHLSYDRVANIFENAADDPTAPLFRDGMWDIWWSRDFDTYGQAQCVQGRLFECSESDDYGVCVQQRINDCASDERYDLNNWPVSDRMWVYVDRELAARIWDAGVGGESVAVREPQSALDLVYRDITPLTTFGTDVFLNSPRGIDVAADGTVVVADTNNSRIVTFNPQGELISVMGIPAGENNVGELGVLFQPWGVEVADNGNIYIADTWNHRVQVFSPQGQPLFTFGEYGTPDQGVNPNALWGPRDLTIDIDGNILVADTGGKRVRVYTPDGIWVRDIGNGAGSALGQLEEPVGLAVNPVNGEVVVADTWNQRIQVFSPQGQALRQWDVPMWYDARSLPHRPYVAISPDGSLIAVTDMSADGRNDGPRVVVYDLAGNPLLTLNAPETDFAAGLHGIRVVGGLEFSPQGELYVLDAETSRVVKFPVLPVVSSLSPAPVPNGAGAGAPDGVIVEPPAEQGVPENPLQVPGWLSEPEG